MNYIQRAKIAQKILTAAPGINVIGVHLYGYRNAVQIHTTRPIPRYEYAPDHGIGHPTHRFSQDDIEVSLVYMTDEEEAS